jgi:hypothetical protein
LADRAGDAIAVYAIEMISFAAIAPSVDVLSDIALGIEADADFTPR